MYGWLPYEDEIRSVEGVVVRVDGCLTRQRRSEQARFWMRSSGSDFMAAAGGTEHRRWRCWGANQN